LLAGRNANRIEEEKVEEIKTATVGGGGGSLNFNVNKAIGQAGVSQIDEEEDSMSDDNEEEEEEEDQSFRPGQMVDLWKNLQDLLRNQFKEEC